MSSEHLVGTSIPVHLRHPHHPGQRFYALCAGTEPLCMIFLPGFDHPVTREYLTRYLKTLPRLRGVRLACVVRSAPRAVAEATQGKEFPFPIICDAPGVLYSYLGVEQARGLLSWSFSAQRIYKSARDAGYHYDPQCSADPAHDLDRGAHEGKKSCSPTPARSQTDLPEDCIAIRELAREVVHTKAADQRRASHHCSDETLTLPDLIGWDDVDNDQ